MSQETGDEDLTPVQRRLSEHLHLLRVNPPTTTSDLVAGIVRRARWQIVVRDPFIFVGAVSAAMAEAFSLLSTPPVGQR